MQPTTSEGEPLTVMCPCCNTPVVIDDKTLGKLWGTRMKARRVGRPDNSRFAKMTAEQRKIAATEAAQARWSAHRAAKHNSIAAPPPEPPKKQTVLARLDAMADLFKESKTDG